MLHMFILTVLSRWSLFNLGLYVFSIIFPVFLSGTLKVPVESSELISHGYFLVTLIVRNIQIPICLSSILLLEQTSWIFPPLGFQSWVGSKYLFYDDYFNIFLLEAFKKKKNVARNGAAQPIWRIHLEQVYNFRQPGYGKAINTWVGRTSLKVLTMSVGVRGQHLEALQATCRETTYGWCRVSVQARATASRQHTSVGAMHEEGLLFQA